MCQMIRPRDWSDADVKRSLVESKQLDAELMEMVAKSLPRESSTTKGRHRPPKVISEHKHIRLILVDDSNKDEGEGFDVPSSVALKSFFNDYAEKRGASVRSFRFSYNGKTMFLSSVGKQSPEELNMQDQDVITVHDTRTSAAEEKSCVLHQTRKKGHEKSGKTQKRNKCKSKKRRTKYEEQAVTLEEYKRRHSMTLSRVHEEVQPRLKTIRTRLNALGLERQPPKKKKTTKKKKLVNGADLRVLPNLTVGGKAGKPSFLVRVGEESNLYRTTKLRQTHGSCDIPVLDLHGFTREEALFKLEESRKVWVDMAIQGSYPFVIPAMIVCGCGNQILSEMVQKWIRSTENICNAPKN